MSCRRNDRHRFVGCHVGSVRVSGCSKGCCHFWGPEGVEEHERYHYDRPRVGEISVLRVASELPARHCMLAGRPKYVCFDCKRGFKHAFVEGNEYRISNYRTEWMTRPDRRRIADVWEAYAAYHESHDKREKFRVEDVERAYRISGYKDKTVDGYEQTRACSPELWWTPLDGRCPGCGKAGRSVGDTFRIPKVKDDKAWQNVKRMVNEGEAFSYCMTPDEENELIREVARVRDRAKGNENWAQEKRRRLEFLGLAMPIP
ncbi:hypothetical protein BV25DRAFT_156402 [Artomyces pyxidatus]|uniref:Uncharacterized protein n=1 Tax=Artomyces pyxidatus TaxID=48021 RepID=A0ACB8T9Q2_9AGAM|nr:hypothetical protein BV25DRAFT_156402 [Artomyces pyxidatus]